MVTDKQKQAARENGKKSHGPTSADGKAVSSQNAVTYGFRSTRWLVRNDEDRAQLNALIDGFTAEYQPYGPTETALVRDLAHSRFSLERIWAIQIAGLDCEVEEQRPRLERNFPGLDEPTCLYLAFNALARSSPGLALLNRYQISYDRAFHRARKALLETQAARRAPEAATPPDAQISDFQPNPPSRIPFELITLPPHEDPEPGPPAGPEPPHLPNSES